MKKTKISFGLLILFFTSMIILVSLFYYNFEIFYNDIEKSSLFEEFTDLSLNVFNVVSAKTYPLIETMSEKSQNIIGSITGEATSNESGKNNINDTGAKTECSFVPSEELKIVLRMDDLGAWHYYDTVVNMTDTILQKNMSVSLGIIPYSLEKDEPFVDFINSIKDNPRVEIAQHGYLHEENEFKNLTYEEAYGKIQEGKNSMMQNFEIAPETFVPPSNEYNEETIQALKDNGFKIISARDSEYKSGNSFFHVGSDTQTFDYYNNRFVSVEEVIEACKSNLDEKKLCVVVIHPQDYVYDGDKFNIDPVKYAEFERLLNELNHLGADFQNFEDLIECREPLEPAPSQES